MDYPAISSPSPRPSGTGKSSLVKALLELDSHLVVSISHTTRKPRGQEQDGREYHFVDEPEFRR
jgi:guanylate kinase